MFRYPMALLATFAACLGLQTVALRLSGGKTVKSESNYFSSIARIQTESQGKPKIMLLGSSMTARLGDRARHYEGVANLGCDGGSAVVTLRAMDRGLLPTAPVLVIEANTLSYELEHRGKEIGEAIGSEWFQIGMKSPNLGATARPTAFAYSWLMARKLGGKETGAVVERLPISTKPGVPDAGSASLSDTKASALADEISGILTRLKTRGSEILILVLPPASAADSLQTTLPRAVAARAGVPLWDLTEGLPPGAVGFSDGLHLDGPGAEKTLFTLIQELKP